MTTPPQPDRARIWEIAMEEYAKPSAAAFSGDEWEKPRTVQIAIGVATRALDEQREFLLEWVCSGCGVRPEDHMQYKNGSLKFKLLDPYVNPITAYARKCGVKITRADFLSRQEATP